MSEIDKIDRQEDIPIMSKREATVLLSRVFQGLFHTLELSSDSGSQLLPSCGAEACLSKEQRRDCWGLRAGESMESIYKVSRQIKQKEHSLYNALRSIYHDSLFVAEIAALWPRLPLLANLRCGLWYSQHFYDVCYFKSTDGHNGNWSFNVTRLNLHVAELAGILSPETLPLILPQFSAALLRYKSWNH